MSFLLAVVLVWVLVLLAWVVVSRYFKSADATKIKERLSGGGNKAKKVKTDAAGSQSVINTQQVVKNKFAQLLVEKYRLGPRILQLLEQAGLKWPPARLVHLCLVGFGAGFAATWLLAPLPHSFAILGGLVAGAAPFVYVWYKRKSRLRRFEELFPEALEFIGRSMRAGHAFSASLEMIHREFQEPVAGEFRRTFEEHNLGLPVEVALEKLAARVPSLDVHFFVSAVLLQKRTGGNLAEILDKLAYVIRERFKLRGRIRAVSAHGKMTATALSAIPMAVGVLMFFTNPDYVKFFFYDDVGNMMLGGAVVLQLIGYGVMKKIVNIEV
ncbi:MAG TPA: type II secretion system F family protein [Bryobacteraceae bacterium]|nr:type II secretion system F family protein [Bryobacteraceae bacterium]